MTSSYDFAVDSNSFGRYFIAFHAKFERVVICRERLKYKYFGVIAVIIIGGKSGLDTLTS